MAAFEATAGEAVRRDEDLRVRALTPTKHPARGRLGRAHDDRLDNCIESIVTARSAELNLLRRISDDADKAVLAGSSIHFDHSFIRRYMPELNARLSHRTTTWRGGRVSRGLRDAAAAKTEAHRAAQDVLNSIAQAKAVAEWFRGTRLRGNDR